MYNFLSGFFCLTFLAGLMVVVGDGIWYLRFRRAVAELGRYAGGFIISQCPVCSGELTLVEQKTMHFGIPAVSRAVTCGQCTSKLKGVDAGMWRWKVDESANPEIAWLYGNETLTDRELQGISAGRHTAKAQAKIVEREEQRRRQARAAALVAITAGDMSELAKLEDRLIETPSGVQVIRGNSIDTRLEMKKGEVCLVVMRPVNLGEQRTKDNLPYAKTVDSGGEFVVTNQRYGYVGLSKSVQQKLDVITAVDPDQHSVSVTRSNRKAPEFFMGLDGPLAAAVLRGAGRKT